MNPQIFISAVTKELKSIRQQVANTLTALGYEPVWQDIFETQADDLQAMLRRKIDRCKAVIQIVGDAYGAAPPEPDETFGRISYTQYEALYAKSKGKKVYYLIVQPDAQRDSEPGQIDTQETEVKAVLQRDYQATITGGTQIYYPIIEANDPELVIRRLKQEGVLPPVWIKAWMLGTTAALILIAIGVFWLNLGQQQVAKELPQKLEQAQDKTGQHIEQAKAETHQKIDETQAKLAQQLSDPAALADRIRDEIRKTTQNKIKQVPAGPQKWQEIAKLENERDLALSRVDDLIELIQTNFAEGAVPVFLRAIDILKDPKAGTDAALEYLQSRRESTLETARKLAGQAKASQAQADAEKEQRNKELQPLVLEAKLREGKLEWDQALKLREQVASIAPDWFDARTALGLLYLLKLGQFEAAEPHLRAAVKLAKGNQQATAFNNLANLLQETNQLMEAEPLMRRALVVSEASFGPNHSQVATKLSNLAQLLHETNRLMEAESLMRRALRIDEAFYGPNDPKISLELNNLAQLLIETNRLVEAESLMRRALAIDEAFYGPDHPNVTTVLNNFATLLIKTNRLVEAGPLMRRALTIDEASYGTNHVYIARELSNISVFLQMTNRLAEAEPLMRRALTIDEASYGPDHTLVATRLNNLSALLNATNRLDEAESLMRQALAIREHSYGSDHPAVELSLYNLAVLFKKTNRLAEAELFYQRALEILQCSWGKTHPRTKKVQKKYQSLLQKLKQKPETIEKKIQQALSQQGPFSPIVPEIEQLLGPAQPVAEVLQKLDQQYRKEGKPPVYFLKAEEPIAPHLSELCQPHPDYLNKAGVKAYRKGDYAQAVVLYEHAMEIRGDGADEEITTRMNHAAALRELGLVQQAREALHQLVLKISPASDTSAAQRGRVQYHLAYSEWRLENLEAAKAIAETSVKAYGDDKSLAALKAQSEQLLADIAAGKSPPPLPIHNPAEELKEARKRYQTIQDLGTLPTSESILPMLEKLFGPVPSTKTILNQLDQQYRELGKPDIYFLPLTEPIAPHLDELLGPLPEKSTTVAE